MGRCVIVGGADIRNYERVRSYLKQDDFLIYCDCGLKHEAGLLRQPDLIIGDFDSFDNPERALETIVLPHVKDDTDTVFAAKEGLSRGYDEFLLLGVFGNRMDHTLANLYLLLYIEKAGASVLALDDYSEYEIVGREWKEIPDTFPYFSLVALEGPAQGITIENAFYNLQQGVVSPEYQYGVSNEPIQGKTARVKVEKGSLLLIRDFQ